jgi:hypothetical protein
MSQPPGRVDEERFALHPEWVERATIIESALHSSGCRITRFHLSEVQAEWLERFSHQRATLFGFPVVVK